MSPHMTNDMSSTSSDYDHYCGDQKIKVWGFFLPKKLIFNLFYLKNNLQTLLEHLQTNLST
jgi:hypothetical protein